MGLNPLFYLKLFFLHSLIPLLVLIILFFSKIYTYCIISLRWGFEKKKTQKKPRFLEIVFFGNSTYYKTFYYFKFYCFAILFNNASSSVLEKLIFNSSAFVFIHLGIFTVFLISSFPHFAANELMSTAIYVLNLET